MGAVARPPLPSIPRKKRVATDLSQASQPPSQPSQPPSQPSQSARTTRASSQGSSQVRAVGSCHARPKMTSRFRRLPAMTRGQAPRPGVVEDRSSCADHHHRIWSMKTVSSLYHFPMKISGEISPELRGIFPGIAGIFHGKLRGNFPGIRRFCRQVKPEPRLPEPPSKRNHL